MTVDEQIEEGEALVRRRYEDDASAVILHEEFEAAIGMSRRVDGRAYYQIIGIVRAIFRDEDIVLTSIRGTGYKLLTAAEHADFSRKEIDRAIANLREGHSALSSFLRRVEQGEPSGLDDMELRLHGDLEAEIGAKLASHDRGVETLNAYNRKMQGGARQTQRALQAKEKAETRVAEVRKEKSRANDRARRLAKKNERLQQRLNDKPEDSNHATG